jgi:hypothetical protein
MNGALTSFPLQLLVTSDPSGKKLRDVVWLLRKYAVTVLPSPASLKILRESKVWTRASKPMIGFGDPVFDRTRQTATERNAASFNRNLPELYRGAITDAKSFAANLESLPETADELRTVAKKLGARSEDIKLGNAASVQSVKHTPLTVTGSSISRPTHLSLAKLKNSPRQRRNRLLSYLFPTSLPRKMMDC